MATGPVRSQPLHNFALPVLKWGSNFPRKLLDSTQQPQETSSLVDHNSSSLEAINGCEKQQQEEQPEFENRKNSIASRSFKNRLSPYYFSSPLLQKKNPTFSESETGVYEYNSGSRHHTASKDEAMEKNKQEGGGEGVVEVGESTPKPWNLRPRRVFKTPTEIKGGGASTNGEVQEKPENLPKSLRLRGFVEGQNVETKEKRKFWISLSRDEIEEDFFIMTGSKPPRRLKKRAKNVQKQVDNVFPGLWLVGTSVDSYTVPEGPAKK